MNVANDRLLIKPKHKPKKTNLNGKIVAKYSHMSCLGRCKVRYKGMVQSRYDMFYAPIDTRTNLLQNGLLQIDAQPHIYVCVHSTAVLAGTCRYRRMEQERVKKNNCKKCMNVHR